MRKVRLWLALMAILVATAAGGQSTISVTAAEYFFDTDPGYGKATVINNAVEGEQTLDISTSALSVGAHILCMRSLGSNGVWSSTMTKPVYVMHTGNNTYSVEYFFDNDPGYGKGNVLIIAGSQDVTIDIDTKDVTPGAHMLYLRSQDTNGNWSSVMAHPLYVFTILPVAALEYYIDNNDPGEGLAISVPVATATAAAATFDIDTSELTPGEHTLNIRAMGIDSVWTAISSRTFTVDGPAEPEHYAVLTGNDEVITDPETGEVTQGKTLTFYYDAEKQARSGLDIGPFSMESVDNKWVVNSGWFSQRKSITSVVFDNTFASDTTVTSTAYWFYECRKLSQIEGIENLNTASVTDMAVMFSGCSGLTRLDVSGFNTANVRNLWGMFADCSGLMSLDVSNFKTDDVTDMSGMFYECSALTTLDVSGFKTDNVTNMIDMFGGCSSLTSLDLSDFNTANVTVMEEMFYGCSELKTIYAGSGWSTKAVTESGNMFTGCTNLVGGKGTTYDADHIDKAYAHIDGGISNPGYLTDKNAPAEPEHYAVLTDNTDVLDDPVTGITYGKTLMFYYDTEKQARGGMDIGPFDDVLPDWSQNSDAITRVVFDESFAIDTTLTSTANWFTNCRNLSLIEGIKNLNTANVTDMHSMFESCSALIGLDMSGFNTTNVENVAFMFYGCSSLANLEFDNFNVANVWNMKGMFIECTGLTSLDLSTFNTAKVSYMDEMFRGCSNLTTIYVGSGWNTDNVNLSDNMFLNCTKLVGGKGTVFDADHIDKAYAHIDGGTSNPGYLTDKNAPAEPEHYAVLADNDIVINPEGAALSGKTLTFFYDTKKAERSGMSVGPFDLPQNREWESLLQNITTVQFDESMANDTTVTSTAYWFYGCQNLEYVYGTENLKTQNVTDMKYMFYDCNVLQEVNLSGFNTANVTDMTGMFYKCHSLQTIDLTNFNTSKVTNMSWMFYNCSAVTKIYAGSYWTTTAVRESEDMFVNCTHVVGSAGTTYDANHVDAAYAHIDGGPSNPGYLSDKNAPVVPDPEPYVVLDSTTMTFYYDTEMNSRQGMPIVAGGATVTWGNYAGGITNVVFTTSFADYLPISTASWFSGFKSLTTITGIENLKTDSVKSMRSMFQGCASLIHVDMSQFNTSKVEDFGYIFNSCSSLAAIQAGYAMIPAEEYARVDNPNLLLYVNEPSLVPQSVQNVVVRDFAKTIILTDEVGTSGNNNFYAPKSFTAEMISYSHEYRQQTVNGISRGWESIVLPFTVQTIVNERNGVIAPFGNSASELHFWLRQLISDGIVRATQIEANKAYIISMPNNEEEYPAKYNQNGRVTFSSENALVPATVVEGVEGKIASGEIVTLMPNFQKKYANENFYALNVGEERLYNGTSYPEGSVFERGYRAVRPFEAYTIHHGSSPAPQFISIADITNGDNLTGINDAIRLNDEQMINDKWYDLNGQQLQKKPTRKGVYLHNGRKVIIR